jgi:hypothetical protein
MAYNESGHAKNVANFDELMVVLGTLGGEYNPASPAIQLDALTELQKRLQIALQKVNDANGVYRDKIYARQNAYEQMNALAMRIVNTMAGLGFESKILTQAKGVLSKIRGGGAKKKKEAGEDGTAEVKSVSVSQMSFDQRKNNFSVLVGLIDAQATYKPNEADMQVVSLKKYLDELQEFNREAIVAEQGLIMARQERDVLLYAEGTGVSALVQQIKAYAKGAFGTKNASYERIKGIKFTSVKSGR